jgi:N4-gp56 family major capsid protein
MSTTAYGVNHPLAVKLWAKELYHDIIGESYIGKFMGRGADSMVQVKSETSKQAGDKVTFGLRGLLTGDGVQGDATLEGNEEALITKNDSVTLNQIRWGVRTAGKMTEQRVNFDIRDEAKDALRDWWTERLEVSLANQLTGYTGQSDTKFTGNNATVAPTATYRILCGGSATAGAAAAEGSLSATTTHAIALRDLDRAVAIAKAPQTVGGTTYQRIRPLSVDGKKMYVAFLHPWQIFQLRRDASTAGNFFDIQKAAIQGGKYSDNPIVNGANFVYNNVLVHEWSYLPNIVTTPSSGAVTDYRRGVFCGAQAAAIAFGQDGNSTKMSWNEEMFDYGNQLGVEAGLILGVKKTVFDSVDFATIVLSGYAPSP